MANTTNFGWETPDDTDLVKDGAAAIRTLGSAIDTSMVDLKGGTTGQNLRKNSNTDMDFTWAGDATNTVIDAEGDLLVGDSADTLQRLAIGTNGQILTVDTAVDGKIKWAAAASSGALTLIKRASFSNVANTGTTFDDVFSSSYNSYQIKFEDFGAATTTDDIHFQWRYAGPTTQTSQYYGNNLSNVFNSTTTTNNNANNAAQATLNQNTGGATANQGSGTFFVDGCSGVSKAPRISGLYIDSNEGTSSTSFFMVTTNRIYTGFLVKSSSSNITGTIAIYGLA